MAAHVPPAGDLDTYSDATRPNRESHSSGVSWGAVIGGACAACALYLILLALGAGFGLSAISPWAGARASTIGTVELVWLILIEIAAAAFGGYLTGRLRTKWALIHTDEVFFRDTANGFLSWALALVVSVAFLASAAAFLSGSAARTRTSPDSPSTAVLPSPQLYYIDMLFRSERPVSDAADAAAKAEAGRILMNGLEHDQLPPADQNYLAHLVSARTGIAESEAEQRVSNVFTQAQQTEDAARKTTARILLWLFLSLLIGALSASFAATIGGRQRDHVRSV